MMVWKKVTLFIENMAIFSIYLVGGFNPFEKYQSNWVHLPQIGVKIKNV